jgi:hypothetical protein
VLGDQIVECGAQSAVRSIRPDDERGLRAE